MKFSFTLLLSLVCIICKAQDKTKTIESEDKSFSLQYPEKWSAKARGYGDNQTISIQAPASGDEKVIFTVTRSPLDKDIRTLSQLVAKQSPEIKKQMKIEDFKSSTPMGNKHLLMYDVVAGKKTLKVKSYLWMDKGYWYMTAFAATPISFNAYYSEEDAMTKSVSTAKPSTALAGPKSTNADAAQKDDALVEVDCSSISGYNIITKAPQGITPTSRFGSVRLSNNKNFQLQISKDPYSKLEDAKKELAANQMNVLKKYIIEEPEGILYQSEAMGQTQYHFKYYLKLKDATYLFEDQKGVQYDLKSAQQMYKAAKETVAK